ncbi:MAG: cytochrome ubiquinol oxidase subunit I [Phycisphaeraceae bacterium]
MTDVVLLSRIQFALTVMFHYLFPPLTIGMGVVLVYLEGKFLATKQPIYESAAKFWTKIFALNFAVGVATGIVMEFQFGTNWATYSRFVGDVFGSALAAEGIFAFFLESGFLAVLVFGWEKVGPKMHFFSTIMVSLGSIFSSVWIVVANSWQQTPTGHHIVQKFDRGGNPFLRAEVTDFWAVVFNPSTVHRLSHVLIGCFIMGAFFIMSISAYYILRNRHVEFAKKSFLGGLLFATIFSLIAPVSGHFQARNVYKYQPAKLAAFEGHYQTGVGDLSLFGIPNDKEQKLDAEIAIPGALSFLLFDDFQTPVIGLDKFKPADRPPVAIPFVTYHLMIAFGTAFIAMTLLAWFFHWRGKLWNQKWLLGLFVVMVLGAVIANQAGWIAAEVGRQPWIVQAPLLTDASGNYIADAAGHYQYDDAAGLRTSHAASKVVQPNQVLFSIIAFSLIYVLLGAVWIYVLNHKIHQGPESFEPTEGTEGHGKLADAAAALAAHRGSMTETH